MENRIKAYVESHKEEILNDLLEFVETQAATAEVEQLGVVRKKLNEIIEKHFENKVDEIKVDSTRNCLYTKLVDNDNQQPILMIGHYDTVHPSSKLSVRREDNLLFGPGVCDMKGGIIIGLWACKAINDLGLKTNYPIYMLNNGDEETGSRDSEHVLIEKATGTRATLVLEPAFDNGELKTGRKGARACFIVIRGKASHAGLHPEEGISAIQEAAHHILALHALNDNELGTTINVGVVKGGTVRNVVADEVILEIDIRVKTISEIDRIQKAIEDIPLMLKGTTKEVTFNKGTPPLEENEKNIALYELYKESANNLGIEVGSAFVGGASDGNRLAYLGIPILDGLGAVGKGMHAMHEQIDLDQYFDRITMLAGMLTRIK